MPRKIPPEVKKVRNSKIEQNPSDKHISYSQLSVFSSCQKLWYEQYVNKTIPYSSTIYTVFGSSLHETLQEWLRRLYEDSVKASEEMDMERYLEERLIEVYREARENNNGIHFTTKDELQSFYEDGVRILNFIRKNRKVYFSSKNMYLAGIETLLYKEIRPGVFFKGFVDVIFYDSTFKEWYIFDIKTSTSGWSKFDKADDIKISQVLLYKKFLSELFDIPIDSIKVKYFIVKRRVNENAEYSSMRRYVQEFEPPSGKVKIKQVESLLENFTNTALDENGNFIEKEYPTSPSKKACRFCKLKELRLCPDAVF